MKQITNRAACYPLHAGSFSWLTLRLFKAEVIGSSETPFYFRRIIRRSIQEEITLQLNRSCVDMLRNLFITLWIGGNEKQNIFITNIHVLPTFCSSMNITHVYIRLCCRYQSFWCLTRAHIVFRIPANLNSMIYLPMRNLT